MLSLTEKEKEFLIGLLEDTIDDEEFETCFAKDHQEACISILEKLKMR